MNAVQTPQAVLAWIDSNRASNSFAQKLSYRLRNRGYLTAPETQAVERSLAPRPANAQVSGAGFAHLLQSFQRAKETGLRYPKVSVGTLRFSLAGDDSRNAGYLYVKANGEYAGKISPAGEFSADRHATAEQCDDIVRVARDPLAAAVKHGHETGLCAICSRPLSDPESVTRGIGPICAKRFGW
jgi:Family of unknown function (DUF6011)